MKYAGLRVATITNKSSSHVLRVYEVDDLNPTHSSLLLLLFVKKIQAKYLISRQAKEVERTPKMKDKRVNTT